MKESLLHISNIPDYNIKPDIDKNILENFITEFTKNANEHFAWDANSGGSTRKSFLLKAAVVSQLIKSKIKGKHIGIMLPALQSTTLLIIASYMAGKIPVMFNWTLGPKVLSHCANITKVDTIITADAFYNKIEKQLPDDIKDRLFFLNKEISHINLLMKVKGALAAKFPEKLIDTNIDKTAVILFTSGSETMPKAVPLTHENIIADLWGVLSNFNIRANSVFLSFLPPFHSFGFSVLSILPLTTATKVAYTPNPTSIKEVLEALRHTKANNIMVTPTLLKLILSKATKEDLSTVELVISGAESLHQDILNKYNKMTDHKSLIVEGYGITECSPIVSLNPRDKQKLNSVGKCINGLESYVIDLDADQILEANNDGMIVVRGKSIFNGYLDQTVEMPLVKLKGKDFYKTGDIGHFDEEGYLFITGRLKRFIKIGGEMISMPFIEKILESEFGEEGRSVLAVEGCDKMHKPMVVLFSNIPLDINEVNKHLRKNGVSTLAKIRDVKIIEEIPLLGSGKTDYRLLKSLVKEEAPETH